MMIKSWFSPFEFSSQFQAQLESYGIRKKEHVVEEPDGGDVLIYPDLLHFTAIPNLRQFTEQDIDEITRKYASILTLQLRFLSYSQSSLFEVLSKTAEMREHSTTVAHNQFYSETGPISLLVCRLIFNNHQDLLDIYSQVEANATSPSKLTVYFQGSYQDAWLTPSSQEMLNDWWKLQNINTNSCLSRADHLLAAAIQHLITVNAISDVNKNFREMLRLVLKDQPKKV